MLFLTRTLPFLFCFVFGVTSWIIYYVPHEYAQTIEREFALWLRLVFAFAYVLGLVSLLSLHWAKIRQRQAGWAYSLIVYISFGVMMLFVVYNDGNGPFAPQETTGPYQWTFINVHVASSATMFSLLAFFISSAAYRTFRARTPEAAILLVSAIIVMLGRVPIGAYISDVIPEAMQWLMSVPNMAAKRGILLGVSLGAIATSLRIIFGIERSYLGGGDD
ncbi:MAG TPA: hypothetical protein EYQ31_01475 [Candidatus Handelsmanbacteria bacterium]|jgi:hypothetical protein|nr:hypothetical protein [Candidatus Latescibacterota bacterium]HIG16060.1 hypothetical protein [Candidatus Handelsmanbacteria bacterium]